MDKCIELPDAIEYSLLKKVRAPFINKLMDINKTDIILDVGSGGGYFTKIIARKSNLVICLDLSIINLNNAKKSIDGMENIHFVVGDATYFPFKNNIFDKILATEVIEHIEDDTSFVNECERILKNNGSIIITTPCTNPSLSLDWLRRRSGVNIETDFGHVRSGYTRKEIELLFKKTNFKIIDFGYYSQFFTELARICTYIGRSLNTRGKSWVDGTSQSKIIKTKTFKIYRFFFPIIYQISKLDKIFYLYKGHQIILKASKHVK